MRVLRSSLLILTNVLSRHGSLKVSINAAESEKALFVPYFDLDVPMTVTVCDSVMSASFAVLENSKVTSPDAVITSSVFYFTAEIASDNGPIVIVKSASQ